MLYLKSSADESLWSRSHSKDERTSDGDDRLLINIKCGLDKDGLSTDNEGDRPAAPVAIIAALLLLLLLLLLPVASLAEDVEALRLCDDDFDEDDDEDADNIEELLLLLIPRFIEAKDEPEVAPPHKAAPPAALPALNALMGSRMRSARPATCSPPVCCSTRASTISTAAHSACSPTSRWYSTSASKGGLHTADCSWMGTEEERHEEEEEVDVLSV